MASKPESSDSKDNPSRKEGSKEKSWANARGKRELQEIVIETYENEDPVSVPKNSLISMLNISSCWHEISLPTGKFRSQK